MNLSSEISLAKKVNALTAYDYVRAATYGKNTIQMLYELAAVHSLKRKLEWNTDRHLTTPASIQMLTGKKVEISSLSKQNNTLFLDTSKNNCYDLEFLNCLSDSQVCKVVEKVKSLCKKM